MKKLNKLFNSFVENPTYLFAYFVFVNMLPTMGLMFTEPVNIEGKIVLFFVPLGLYFVLFTISKNIGLVQLLFFPLLFFHAFQIVVFYLFGEDVVSADMFLNAVTTSVSEAGEVLNSLIPSIVFVIIAYLPATYMAFVAMRRKIYLDAIFRRMFFYPSLVLLLLTYGISFYATNYNTDRFDYHEEVYPINLLYNLDFAIDRWSMSNNYYLTSKDFTFNAKKVDTTTQREIYVLVVGETARSDNWSLYGYERETTPLLGKDTNLVIYSDAITQSNTTHKSVPIILSAASAEYYDILYEHKSIVEAFNEVNFSTVFLSNQAANRTFTDFFAHEADVYKYNRFFGEKTNHYDEILVDQMKHYIDSIDGDLFFVLHTYGSHFNYTERYPDEFAVFGPDNIASISKRNIDAMIHAYDNTILYTDYVLGKIISTLGETNACTAMFYISDHGEDLLDDSRERFLHASPSPTYYQLKVPFLFWFSPEYQKDFPAKVQYAQNHKDMPVASNLVFYSFLDMAGINTDYSDDHLSLVNKNFKERKRMYLDDHYNPIEYQKAGLKKQDLEMIKKRKMKF